MSRGGPTPTTVRRYAGGAIAVARSFLPGPAGPAGPGTGAAPVAPPVPPGWVVAPPDFVGVGTARSGTSWWDALLHQHPGVARAPGVPKEVHFFDRFWSGEWSDADVAAYHGFFARPPGALAGEWTPGYVLDPWTPPLLHRAAPDARLLVLLRDPVERFRSDQGHAQRSQAARVNARAAANAAFQRGLYADQLLRLWRAVPRERTLVLQFERCVRDPRTELARTFTFLGLDPGPSATVDVAELVEEARGPRGDLLIGQQETLVARYASENRRLAALLGEDLDLSLWAAPR